MTPKQALDKIKKCLALSKSPNEHEAAAGLRQAQALMRQFGMSEEDIGLAEVTEKPVAARNAAVARWEAMLAQLIDDAFGCAHYHLNSAKLLPGVRVVRTREVRFVGLQLNVEVASYAFDVLYRQCGRARAAYVKQQPASCKPSTKTARGDEFALGWVLAVRKLVQAFAGAKADPLLIEAYFKRVHPEMTNAPVRDRVPARSSSYSHLHAGMRAGERARLNKALGEANAPARLGHVGAGR